MKNNQPYFIGEIVAYDNQSDNLWKVEWCDDEKSSDGYINWNVMFKRLSDGYETIIDMQNNNQEYYYKTWVVITPAFERLWK